MERILRRHPRGPLRRVASLALATGIFAFSTAAHATQLPADFTVEGRLFSSGGAPLTTAVDIKLELVDEGTPTCVLYRELRPNVDLSSADANAQGVFSLRLGAVTAQFGQGTLESLFAPGTYAGDSCSATAAAGSHRLVRISVSAAGQNAYETLSPDTRVTSVPLAMLAENALAVQGVGTSSLLILNGSSALQQPNFEYLFTTTNYGKLKALVDGTSSTYLGANLTAPVPFGNQRLTNLADPTAAQDAVTKHYADTTIGGSAVDLSTVGPMTGDANVIKWDAVQNKWVAGSLSTAPTGPAGGDLTGTYPNPTIAVGAITAAKFGTANAGVNRLLVTDSTTGTTIGFATCSTNQVYAWTATGWACTNVASLSPVTSVANKTGAVTLNAMDINGIGSAATRDVGTAANQIPALDGNARLPGVDGSQLVNVNAMILQSNPVANVVPTSGQVLTWNGLAWTPLAVSTGSVSYVGAGTGLTGGPVTSVGSLAVDVGTAASKIVQLDAGARLPAVDGSKLFNVSAGALLGRPLGASSPLDGQVLGWNATASQWVPTSAATGTMTSVTASTGLLGGVITTNGTIAVDVGTTGGKILQLTPSAQIPSVDGSLMTNVSATKLLGRALSSVGPAGGQVLGWNMTTTQWEPTSAGLTQWLPSSSNIYYAAGSVGIGTSNPLYPLTVAGNIATSGAFVLPGSGMQLTSWSTDNAVLMPTATNGNGNLAVTPSGTNYVAALTVAGSGAYGTSAFTKLQQSGINGFLVNNGTGSLGLGTSLRQNQIFMDPGGRVGINTSAPAAGLDVSFTGTGASALIVPRDSTANRPVAPVNGMLRYNTATNAFEGYLNGAWGTIAAGTTSGSVQYVGAGTGLTGGPISTTGTLGVDVGSAAGKIVQENGNAQIAQTSNGAQYPTYSFSGNFGTGMYSTGANQLGLAVNGSAAMTISTSGVVFTGTTNSTGSDSGAVQMLGGLGVSGQIVSSQNVVGTGIWAYAKVSTPYASTSSTSGYPTAPYLNVMNASSGDGLSAVALLQPRNAASTYQAAYLGAVSNTAAFTPSIVMGQQTGANAYAERLRIDPSGNLGVGTTAPGAGLDVATTGTGGSAIIVPRDNAANRPAGVNGMLRYNTTSQLFEVFQGGSWTFVATAPTGVPGQVQFVGGSGLVGSPNFTYTDTGGLVLNSTTSLTTTGSTALGNLQVNGTASFTKAVVQNVVTDTTGTLDASQSNLFTTSYNCTNPITMSNLTSGGSYTVVVTDTGTSACTFNAPGGFTFMYVPPPDYRVGSSHTIYNLMVIGTRVYVNWTTGFTP